MINKILGVMLSSPVENVEKSIESKTRYIMRGNVLNYSYFVKHHDLRDKSY